MKILGFTFGKQLDVAPSEYNDELEASKREVTQLTSSIEELRVTQVRLEETAALVEAGIRVVSKVHQRDLEIETDRVDAEIHQAQRSAKQSLVSLENEKDELQREIDRLGSDHRISEREIEHMVTMSDEANEMDLREATIKIQEEANKEIQTIKEECQVKLEEALESQLAGTDDLVDKLLARMPEFKGRLKGNISE